MTLAPSSSADPRSAGPLDWVMEAVVLAMVCGSPWAFGSVGPTYEFYLLVGIAVLLGLWALRMLVQGRVSWKACPVALCLAAMILLGVLQLTPMSVESVTRLSPGTAAMYERLFPEQPEVLASGQPQAKLSLAPGSTISLYPDASHNLMVQLLAIFALYLIVRNNANSIGALRRLCIAVLINGAALSLFGLIQFFSAEPGTVYWTMPSPGATFGPFINRNHFAFYINLCIGLSLGLLLAGRDGASHHHVREDTPLLTRLLDGLRNLLHEPTSLWITVGLALMISSVVFCLSRGGVLALLGASAACFTMLMSGGNRDWRWSTAVLSFAAALGLLTWFGLERVEARWATLWDAQTYEGGRLFVLTNAWPLIREFPLWGTGYGTFQFVEPLELHTPSDIGFAYVHAHNDYLEDLIEGGVVKLVLRLLVIGLIFRYAFRAIRFHRDPASRTLAAGLLFAFTSIVIHSFFEFGLYIPAITLLATVLCAHLASLGEQASGKSTFARKLDPNPSEPGRQYVAPIAGAAVALAFGLFFIREGKLAATIDPMLNEVYDTGGDVSSLQTLVQLDPSDATHRYLLGELLLDSYRQRIERERNAEDNGDVVETGGLSPQQHLTLALQQVLAARNLNPLLSAPHARLAFYADSLAQADPREKYLERATYLAPADPQLWYFGGLQELEDGRQEQAWKSWRRSLELSDVHLAEIVDRAAIYLGIDEMINHLVPDQPARLYDVAVHLHPEPDAFKLREPFLVKALELYDSSLATMTADDWHTRAQVHGRLGQMEEAADAMQNALRKEPEQSAWRYELAQLLVELGNQPEARRQLSILLGQNPKHAAARRLADQLAEIR